MSDSESAAVIQNLIDAGYDPYLIADFQNLIEKKDVKGQIKLLLKYRKCLLAELHSLELKVDCLDFLINKLTNSPNI